MPVIQQRFVYFLLMTSKNNHMDVLDSHHFLQEKLSLQTRKVAAYDLDGHRVWIKAAGPRTPYLLFRLLTIVIRWLGLAPLRPFNNHGSTEAIAIESRRLQNLAALGLPVPQLLAADTGGILIRDLGHPDTQTLNLHQALARCQGGEERLALLRLAMDALAGVHAKGTYLSQAFARNMVFMPDGRLGFIDFEEDPGQDLTLPECQARDVLCLIFSLSLFFTRDDDREQAITLLADYLLLQSAASREASLAAMTRLQWLRGLPANPAFGKDTVRAQATGAIFKGITSRLTSRSVSA